MRESSIFDSGGYLPPAPVAPAPAATKTIEQLTTAAATAAYNASQNLGNGPDAKYDQKQAKLASDALQAALAEKAKIDQAAADKAAADKAAADKAAADKAAADAAAEAERLRLLALAKSRNSGGSRSPVAAVPYIAPVTTPTPPPVPIKTAPIDTVLFNDVPIDSQLYLDLLFENVGGQELLSISRYDTVNGQDVSYQPIKNLGLIQQEYNPNNLVKLQQTSFNIFNNFSIKFANKIPINTNDPSGNNFNVWIDTDGSIVIELVHMLNDEQVEVQMAYDGTIYEAGI
jgi:hypothetical protein